MTWTIVWVAIWLTSANEMKREVVGMSAPTFESQEECEAYLLRFKEPMSFQLAKHLELAPGTKFAAEGMCHVNGQPA